MYLEPRQTFKMKCFAKRLKVVNYFEKRSILVVSQCSEYSPVSKVTLYEFSMFYRLGLKAAQIPLYLIKDWIAMY